MNTTTYNNTVTLNDEMLDEVQGGSITAAGICAAVGASIVANIIYDAAKKGVKAIIKHASKKHDKDYAITVTANGACGSW